MSGPGNSAQRYGDAWFSVVEGGAFTFSDGLAALLHLDAAEREALRGADGPAAHASLQRMIAARLEDPDAYQARLQEALRQGEAVQLELRLRDGRVLEGFGAPVLDGAGRALGRTVFYRDVTQRHRDAAELRERARRQTAVARLGRAAASAEAVEPLLEAAVSLVAETLDVERAAVLEIAPDGERLTLRAGVGFAAARFGEQLTDGRRTRLTLSLLGAGPVVSFGGGAGAPADVLGEDPGYGAAVLVRCKDRPWGVLGVKAPGTRAYGRDELVFLEAVAGVLGSAVARLQAEAATVESERLARAMFESARDAMHVTDSEGRILDANPAACRLAGLSREALLGSGLLERAPAGHQRAARALWEKLLAEGEQEGEYEVLGPAGAVRSVEYTSVANIVPGRHLTVMRDVTERRQLGARLVLADKMMSVGVMAAGVAHELNNPLAYVNANLGYLAEALATLTAAVPAVATTCDAAGEPLLPEMKNAVTEALQGAARMRVIITDLLALSRSEGSVRGPVDLGPVLESCIHMAWNEIRHRATLERAFAPVPSVDANAARLTQVFLNLLVNAAQAIPEGGAARHRIRVATFVHPSGRVAVEVADTGTGIAPDHLARIFDPFFTTKPVGTGTGLGLSISHHIISSFGGEIEVSSEPGRGTTFRVLLSPSASQPRAPAAPVPPPLRTTAPGPVPASTPAGRILVVDDEPLVGVALRRALGREHHLEVVESASEALSRVRRGGRYDLVLSDLLMPEMTGMDLHAILASEAPELARRMVFLTGGAFTPAARRFLEEHRLDCLEKPFEVAELRAEVRRRLGALSA